MSENRWTVSEEPLAGRTTRFSFHARQVLSHADVISLLAEDAGFRSLFARTLAGSSYPAYFWETPPVTSQSLSRPFECVLVEEAALTQLRPDASPFSSHFRAQPDQPAIGFPNLSGDAFLVVPTPSAAMTCYTHLACFSRTAPTAQVDAFWTLVGRSMRQRVSSVPIWLSTAGMGVSWLHLRLDSRPKYYRHAPYTKP